MIYSCRLKSQINHAFCRSSSYILDNDDDMLHDQVKCDESENEVEIFISAFLFDKNAFEDLKRWFFLEKKNEKK